MVVAKVHWKSHTQFEGHASSGHSTTVDGDGRLATNPMELVLIALCGCTAYDVVNILQKKRQPFTALEVTAEAERAIQPPRVFTQIQLTYRVSGRVARKAVEDAVRLSETKYCSVAAMLNKTANLSFHIELATE
ncbi:MAG: OsmC family protein [Deltaproteobacteria bacterium]|nr:OsmC family protein [Deltaproteobacteria bacterium]